MFNTFPLALAMRLFDLKIGFSFSFFLKFYEGIFFTAQIHSFSFEYQELCSVPSMQSFL